MISAALFYPIIQFAFSYNFSNPLVLIVTQWAVPTTVSVYFLTGGLFERMIQYYEPKLFKCNDKVVMK